MRRLVLWIVALMTTFAFGLLVSEVLKEEPVARPKLVDVTAFKQPVFVPTSTPTPLPTPTPTPTPNIILDYDHKKLDIWGAFTLLGPRPKEFKEVDVIEIALRPHDRAVPPYIAVHTREGDAYYTAVAQFGLITERRVFFATSKPDDFDNEYRFEGEFLRTDFDNVFDKQIPVLQGTLTRSRNGRTIVSRKVSFRMEYLGC